MATASFRRQAWPVTGLETALSRIVGYLDGRRLPYMVIGGIANLVWGVPRTTRDIDITLWAPGREEELTRDLCAAFEPLAPDPRQFVLETRVLPLRVAGFRVDVIFGQLAYEEQAIRRARPKELAGISVRVASPEDVILHKIISDRPQDTLDARGIVQVQGKELDRSYLEPLIRGLAQDLSRPEILERYHALWRS